MAIDPSIIGNVMVPRAPQMPDVNAMMQTRTAGMENVYKIERQRAEDAKAARVAEADEAVKALIPAYAYALGNPADLTGALELAPPELRGALEPYIAQLQGQPPEQVQAALIGSLSSSEVGRAFLEAQGRMQTAEIQRGQLDVARQREAREAAGGKAVQWFTDDAGDVTGVDARGNIVATRPGIGKKAAQATTPEGMSAKTQAKFDEAFPKSSSALRTAVTGMDNTLAALEELINHPGLELISGTVGTYTPDISADAKRAKSLFDQIKAGAGLAALTELKQASPSGGGLGNVSNQEGNTLRDSRGAFLQTQEYQDLRKALIDYYGVLERSKANIIGAFNDTYEYKGQNAAEAILQSSQQQAEEIDRQIEQRFPDLTNQPQPTSIRRVK